MTSQEDDFIEISSLQMFLNVFAMHENILMMLNYNKTISLEMIFVYKNNYLPRKP